VYRYSTNPRLTVLGGANFAFDSGNVPAVPNDILLPNTTDTVLTEAGYYEVSFIAYVVGALASVSINLNSVAVPGGTAGSLAASNEVEISAIVEVLEGSLPATITISNNSFATIGFPVLAPGSIVTSLRVIKLS
jgi:hypothetical protein